MGLSSMVEFIASLSRPGGGSLAVQTQQQFLNWYVESRANIQYNIAPSTGFFAAIAFRHVFGDLPPSAFELTITHKGTNLINVFLTQPLLDNQLEMFILVTDASPAYVRTLNVDIIPHMWEHTIYQLNIASESDLRDIAIAIAERDRDSVYLAAITKALGGYVTPELQPLPLFSPTLERA